MRELPDFNFKAPKPIRGKYLSLENGLTTQQVRVLKALYLVNRRGGASQERICQIVEAIEPEFSTASKFTQWMGDAIGPINPELWEKVRKRTGHPTLLELGYVKTGVILLDGKDPTKPIKKVVYKITPNGIKTLNQLLKDSGESMPEMPEGC